MDKGFELQQARRVELWLQDLPETLQTSVDEAITRATDKLLMLARAKAPKRTGKLASEIQSRVVRDPHRITGIVGIVADSRNEFGKAAAEEYGAHRRINVKAHSARLSHLWSLPIAQIRVQVETHQRKLNIRKRNFLRAALDEVRASTIEDVRAALDEVGEA